MKLISLFDDFPQPIRLFLGKALLVFILWNVAYIGFLSDSKILDYPLTTHVGEASVTMLNKFSSMSGFKAIRSERTTIYEGEYITQESSEIYHNDNSILHIADACNGLELLVLYIGFIICMPSRFWRKVLYIVLGVIVLDLVNIGRCVGLIYLREYYQVYFDFAHHYLFKITVYGVTFLLWMLFARKIHFKSETLQVK